MNIGVTSLKIEGRMKSNLYLASSVLAYRKAIDEISEKNHLSKRTRKECYDILNSVSNRTFSTGGFAGRPDGQTMNYTASGYTRKIHYVGSVKETIENQHIIVEIKAPFRIGDDLEVLCQDGHIRTLPTKTISNLDNHPLNKPLPNSFLKIPWRSSIKQYDVVYIPD